MINQFCPWESAQYLIYSSNIPNFLFYSHIPGMIIALILGIILFRKNRTSIVSLTMLIIALLFFTWSFADLILWATNRPDTVMFFWSIQILVEPIIFALSLYMSYSFFYKTDLPFVKKILLFTPIFILVAVLPLNSTLSGVNLADCTAVEGIFAQYYTYIIEIIYVLTIVFTSFSAYRSTTDKTHRKEIKYFGTGVVLFLVAFSWGNLIGSFTDNWTLAQAGLIGMPIFIAFLTYLIIKFKSFNLKVLGAQVLVVVLITLVSALLFIREIQNVQIVVGFTLFFIFAVGYQLIKAVRQEVAQRERLEVLRLKLEETNLKLEDANDKLKDLDRLKTEFLSLASHQLRSPLTAIKGYASMIMEGSYGEIAEKAKEPVSRIFESSKNLAMIVEDLLNVSKIEQGGMKYEMADFDLGEVVNEMEKELSITAEGKGLKMEYEDDKSGPYKIHADREKIRQIILNFIDNSIKYTKEGSVKVSVVHKDNKVVFSVKDTGMGMTPEIKATLFQKFSRGDGARMNTGGSGLGLYVAKQIVEAHKGIVGVDSDGPGKGSTFWMQLDSVKA